MKETLKPAQLRRFGTVADPYVPNVEIDPFLPGADTHFSRVGGFRRVDEIDLYLQGKIAQELPSYFLVTGRSGSGRSSTANHIMAQYCRHRRVSPDRFIRPRREAALTATESSYKLRVFKMWFSELRSAIQLRRITLSPQLKQDFTDCIKNADEDTMNAEYRTLALNVADELEGAGGPGSPFVFGCCLERVKEYEIILAALDIFTTVPTICVFTVDDYDNQRADIITRFSTKHLDQRLVQLQPLQGHAVSTMLKERWHALCGDGNPVPFDLDELSVAFEDKPRTVGNILGLMNQLLQIKLNSTEDDGSNWPGNPALRLTAADLRNLAVIDNP